MNSEEMTLCSDFYADKITLDELADKLDMSLLEAIMRYDEWLREVFH